MTIEKGKTWGTPSVMPTGTTRVGSDRDLAVSRDSVVVVCGGDLWESLGRPVPKQPGEQCQAVPIDRLTCSIFTGMSTTTLTAASHVRVGRWFGPGQLAILTNVGRIGPRIIAPRAHPNDGRLDLVVVDPGMPFMQRLRARRRMRSGTHVPHPQISTRTVEVWEFLRRGREPLFVDGRRIRGWKSAAVSIESDDVVVLI